jgi:hypothetical protein
VLPGSVLSGNQHRFSVCGFNVLFAARRFPTFICSCGFGGILTIAAMISAASGGISGLGGFPVGTKEDLSSFHAAIGALVISWNRAESILKVLLIALCGANPKTWILTAELGNVGLENALKSASADLAPEELKDHIDHAVEWFSRLREFRNYYVHGINRIGIVNDEMVAFLGQVSAKTALSWHEEYLPVDRIIELDRQFADFISFASGIELHLYAALKVETRREPPLPPLPQMPPLPDRMVKPRRYLQGGIHPREERKSRAKPGPQSRES